MTEPNTPTPGEEAAALFDGGLYCAESVLLTLARRQGHDTDLFPAIATGFCGGLSRSCGPCGAVTGAVMGIGLALGRDRGGEPVASAYAGTQALLTRFTEEFGSTSCPDLLDGCDLSRPEDQQRFRDENLSARCRAYTARATDLAAEIIAAADPGAR